MIEPVFQASPNAPLTCSLVPTAAVTTGLPANASRMLGGLKEVQVPRSAPSVLVVAACWATWRSYDGEGGYVPHRRQVHTGDGDVRYAVAGSS
jgi:hypothetical protein